MRNFVIFLSFLCICCTTLRANSEFHSTTFKHRNKEVRLIIPSELSSESASLLEKSRNSLVQAEKTLELELLDSTEIYFDSAPQYHNGLATVVPRDRIVIHTEAPELFSSIGVYQDYVYETLTHEWAHILSIQQRRGVFRGFSWVLGNSSRPNGLWPRWIHEGLAVYVESSLGGRPSSGWLDFFKRKYAAEFKDSGKHPLNNSSLDGHAALPSASAVGPGQLPYTFGYSMLNAIAERGVSPGSWSEESSNSLGISFRKTLQSRGINIDEVFNQVRDEWARTLVNEETNGRKKIHQSERIAGPFSGSSSLAWIEERRLNPNEDSQIVISKIDNKTIEAPEHFRWKELFWVPTKAVPLENGFWFVVASARKDRFKRQFAHLRSPVRKQAFIYKQSEDSLENVCHFDIKGKIIEAEAQVFHTDAERKIAWVERRSDGQAEIFTAWMRYDCSLAGLQSLTQSTAAFDRFSELRWHLPTFNENSPINPTQSLLSYTKTALSKTSNNTALIGPEGHTWTVERDETETGPAILSQLQKHPSLPLATAILQSREYRGPILIDIRKLNGEWSQLNDIQYAALPSIKLPIQTGSHQALFSPFSDELIYLEKFWRHESLFRFPLQDPTDWDFSDLKVLVIKNQPQSSTLRNTASSPELSEWEDYSPIETIWPKFWTPTLSANNNALIIVGQTFFSDATERWSGSTLAGFNSQLAKPFASQALTYSPSFNQRWGQASLYLEYNPTDLRAFDLDGVKTQDRWTINPSWQSSYTLSPNWVALSSLGLQYVYSPEIGSLDGTNNLIPSLTLSFQSAGAFNFNTSSSSLSLARPFQQYRIKYSWIESSDLQIDLYRLFRTSRKSRLLASIEGAITTIDNFPLSFYTWGGLAPWTPLDSNSFLNRGFDSPYAAGRKIARASLDWHQRIQTPELTLDWNRLRVSYVDLVTSAETITWESYNGTSFRIGEDFASSVGVQLDVGGSALHYIRYKLGVGVFRGFGPKESFRFVTQLKTGLNI